MFNNFLHKLKLLGLPPEEYVVVGSGPLSIRGLRESKDLDVIVTDDLWSELSKKYTVEPNEWGVEKISIDDDLEILNPSQSLFTNMKNIPREKIFEEADTFEGVKFINLNHLREFKLTFGREKDLKDIELIDKFLSSKKVT